MAVWIPPVSIPSFSGGPDYSANLYQGLSGIGDAFVANRNARTQQSQFAQGLALDQQRLAQAQTIADRNYALDLKKYDLAAKKGGGGPYAGTAMDAQNWNIVLNPSVDPSSPAYGAAYSQLFAPRSVPTMDAAGNQVLVPVTPPIPAGIRPPAGGSSLTGPASQSNIGPPVVIGTPRPSDAQLTSALYADRMTKADEIITAKAGAVTIGQQLKAGIPIAGNFLVTEDYQMLEQAERDFLNATLRRESGAVISPSEFENGKKQYFPQPGDSAATLEQKRQNRQTAAAGISRAAGPSYTPPGGAASPGAAPAGQQDGSGNTWEPVN